jgi:PadR family transcriptional regulator, regulatory protein PadR
MSRKLRVISKQAASLLEIFLADPTTSVHGFDLLKATGIQSSTLYPALRQLAEERRLLIAEWEERNPIDGLPRRRFYRLDPSQADRARELLREHRAHIAMNSTSKKFGRPEPA